MIKVRVKTIDLVNNLDHCFTTRINATFEEAKIYFLEQNKYYVVHNLFTNNEDLCKNISVELLEG